MLRHTRRPATVQPEHSISAIGVLSLLVLSSAALVLLIGGLAEHQRYVRDLCLLALFAAGALAAVYVTQARAKP